MTFKVHVYCNSFFVGYTRRLSGRPTLDLRQRWHGQIYTDTDFASIPFFFRLNFSAIHRLLVEDFSLNFFVPFRPSPLLSSFMLRSHLILVLKLLSFSLLLTLFSFPLFLTVLRADSISEQCMSPQRRLQSCYLCELLVPSTALCNVSVCRGDLAHLRTAG